jgi:peptidoglycan hydrolase CwlO-like protein
MPRFGSDRPRAALALAVALAVVVGLAAPASAASLAQLHRARRELATLTARITVNEAVVAKTQGRLDALDVQISRVVARLAEVQQRVRELKQEVADLEARLATLQRRLNELANTSYMNQPGGQLGVVLGLVLGSQSFIQMTDGVEFASRISSETETTASELAAARTRLAVRLASLHDLGSEKAQLLHTLTSQRRRVHLLNTQHQDAVTRLTATRERIVSLIRSLRRQLAARLFPAVGTAFQGSAHTSYGRWAALFLQGLGAPTCHSNEIVLVSWQLAEFTQAAWNPLATTKPMSGSTRYNGAGVQNYPSLSTGLLANKATLFAGWSSYGYGSIVNDLRGCATPYTTANAIRASSWCHGCANGGYVVNKIGEVAGNFELYAAF